LPRIVAVIVTTPLRRPRYRDPPGPGRVTMRGLRNGVVTITATMRGKTGSAQLTVGTGGAQHPVATIAVAPATRTAALGDSAWFVAIPRADNGDSLPGRAVTWTVSDSSVAREIALVGNGRSLLLRGVGRGTVTVRATSERKSATATLTIQ